MLKFFKILSFNSTQMYLFWVRYIVHTSIHSICRSRQPSNFNMTTIFYLIWKFALNWGWIFPPILENNMYAYLKNFVHILKMLTPDHMEIKKINYWFYVAIWNSTYSIFTICFENLNFRCLLLQMIKTIYMYMGCFRPLSNIYADMCCLITSSFSFTYISC